MMHSNLIDKKLTFCVFFSIVSSISYLICDLYKLPLFTYYPAVDEFALGFAKMTETQGPAMYWYGWIGTAFIAASILTLAAASLFQRKTPPHWIGWSIPLLTIAAFGYSLRGFFIH